MHQITAIIIAKNEEQMLENCLAALKWVDQVLVIDNGSIDSTAQIAEEAGAQVIHFEHSSFARLRNEALKHVETEWLVYVDADERFKPVLAKEVLVHMETDDAEVLSMNRVNICFGRRFEHGGWADDRVTRVFKKTALKEWVGDVHETPVYEGEAILLRTPLIHLTHRNTKQGLKKTIEWTQIEAQLLFDEDVPPVKFFTLIRKGLMELLRRAVFWKGYKDGMPGLVEAVTQAINRVLVYIQVWELQQNPSLPELYRKKEIEIMKEWEQENVEQLKVEAE